MRKSLNPVSRLQFPRAFPIVIASAIAGCALLSNAQDRPGSLVDLDTFLVVGSTQNLLELPGAGAFLDQETITRFSVDDIHTLLRRVPGVYVRQEDGFGLFPNLSMRGASTIRNSKLTVMEDGILMAPAAYSAPAAYYTPTVGRMSGVELLKGSSQVKYGPQSTGGVINYLSTPIPQILSGKVAAGFGTDNDLRTHLHVGGMAPLGDFRVGGLVEFYHHGNDGFKTIRDAQFRTLSRDTGFTRDDWMAKARLEYGSTLLHRLEFRYGKTELTADETYLGLTSDDFKRDPWMRYAASRFDVIDTLHERYSLRYTLAQSASWQASLTWYRNDFSRLWYKLNDLRPAGTSSWRNLSEVLAGSHAPALDVLRGSEAGDLRVRANNRGYLSEGWDFAARARLEQGSIQHTLEAGIRYHEDSENRFQWQDIYQMDSANQVQQITRGTPGTQENRKGASEAWAFYLQDRIQGNGWTVTPGVRYERMDYRDLRRSMTVGAGFNQPTADRKTSMDILAPGIGFTWSQSSDLEWFGGVYRGFSVPGPSQATGSLAIREERSVGSELGLRYHPGKGVWFAEVVVFNTEFENLIVENNVGGGGVSGNVGEARTRGLESSLRYDPSRANGSDWRQTWFVSFTWTDATLRNEVNADGSSGGVVESIFAGGFSGASLPYIPEYQVALGTEFIGQRWRLSLEGYHQPATWATASNTRSETRANGALDARFGRTDAQWQVDAAFAYDLHDGLILKLIGTNLLDHEAIVSRVPHGPRPGAPRAFRVGLEWTF